MSRIIKFRAWDAKNKIMHYENIVIAYGTAFLAILSFDTDAIQVEHNIELSEPMQHTGLKDKNGKEIYESDVVRINNLKMGWKHGEPNFDWKKFVIEWNVYLWSFNNSALYKPLSSYDLSTGEGYEIEIIGNIYENEHLLTELKQQ